jgi:hypothetical protein
MRPFVIPTLKERSIDSSNYLGGINKRSQKQGKEDKEEVLRSRRKIEDIIKTNLNVGSRDVRVNSIDLFQFRNQC